MRSGIRWILCVYISILGVSWALSTFRRTNKVRRKPISQVQQVHISFSSNPKPKNQKIKKSKLPISVRYPHVLSPHYPQVFQSTPPPPHPPTFPDGGREGGVCFSLVLSLNQIFLSFPSMKSHPAVHAREKYSK